MNAVKKVGFFQKLFVPVDVTRSLVKHVITRPVRPEIVEIQRLQPLLPMVQGSELPRSLVGLDVQLLLPELTMGNHVGPVWQLPFFPVVSTWLFGFGTKPACKHESLD